jgi:hypothetical protein
MHRFRCNQGRTGALNSGIHQSHISRHCSNLRIRGYGKPEKSGETMPARIQYLRGNKPKLGSFPLSVILVTPGKPRIAFLFCSRGEYGQILPCLPKYGRFAPHSWATKAHTIEPDSAM